MIVIVDYKAGNLTSVQRALSHLGVEATISGDPDTIARAERVIIPGVGHAATAMTHLRERAIDGALRELRTRGVPTLGICLGAQVVLTHSEEGDTPCLGLIEGEAKKFVLQDPSLKIPHMGWNALTMVRPHPLLQGVQTGDEVYFVHSYYPAPSHEDDIFGTSEYEITFAAAIGRGSIFATQFHPEKSGRIGLRILSNFATWDGTSC